MSITIGTFLFLMITICIFCKYFKNDEKLFFNFFIFMILTKFFINIGFFIKVGSFEVMYDEYVTLLVFILSIKFLLYNNFSFGFQKALLLLFLSIFISIFLNLFLTYEEYGITYNGSWDSYFLGKEKFTMLKPSINTIMHIIRIFIFFIIYYTFSKRINKKKFYLISSMVKKISIIIIILFIFEFIFKNFFHTSVLNDLYNKIFGLNEATYTGLGAKVNNFYAVICLYREQSHLSEYFFYVSLFLLISYYYLKDKRYILVSLTLLMLSAISMSFTSLLCIALYILCLIYLLCKFYPRFKKYILIFGIFLLIVFLVIIEKTSFGDRIKNSLDIVLHFNPQKKYAFTSENVRLYSIMYNYSLFFKHILFGIGIGTSYSHGGFSTTLVSIGLIGLILYINVYKYMFEININKKYPYIFTIIICIFFLFTGVSNLMYNDGLLICLMAYSIFFGKDKKILTTL